MAVTTVICGEVAEVEERGHSDGAGRIVRFEHTRAFRHRPIQKEYVMVFGVEFQIKKITHGSSGIPLRLKLIPATVNTEMFDRFLAGAEKMSWQVEKVH